MFNRKNKILNDFKNKVKVSPESLFEEIAGDLVNGVLIEKIDFQTKRFWNPRVYYTTRKEAQRLIKKLSKNLGEIYDLNKEIREGFTLDFGITVGNLSFYIDVDPNTLNINMMVNAESQKDFIDSDVDYPLVTFDNKNDVYSFIKEEMTRFETEHK